MTARWRQLSLHFPKFPITDKNGHFVCSELTNEYRQEVGEF